MLIFNYTVLINLYNLKYYFESHKNNNWAITFILLINMYFSYLNQNMRNFLESMCFVRNFIIINYTFSFLLYVSSNKLYHKL